NPGCNSLNLFIRARAASSMRWNDLVRCDVDHQIEQFLLADTEEGQPVAVQMGEHRDEGSPLIPIVKWVVHADAVKQDRGIFRWRRVLLERSDGDVLSPDR